MLHASLKSRRSVATLAVAIGLALASQAHAEASADAAAKQMDTVVVTATGAQQWIRDAPASISVITREDIERKPVSSIGQLLGEGTEFADLFSAQGHGAGLVKMMGPASYPTSGAHAARRGLD